MTDFFRDDLMGISKLLWMSNSIGIRSRTVFFLGVIGRFKSGLVIWLIS